MGNPISYPQLMYNWRRWKRTHFWGHVVAASEGFMSGRPIPVPTPFFISSAAARLTMPVVKPNDELITDVFCGLNPTNAAHIDYVSHILVLQVRRVSYYLDGNGVSWLLHHGKVSRLSLSVKHPESR